MSETITPLSLEVNFPVPEVPKGKREFQAFLRLLPDLLQGYRGRYVAIHNGQVVDSDPEEAPLILRVQAKIGYVPMHVGLVTDQQLPERIPHYREYRPREQT